MILAHDISGTGPLVVLVHRLTENRTAWDPVVLTDVATVLRVDVRGHGESPIAGPYDARTLAADVHETVRHAELDGIPLIIGHSMGAVVAMAYAHSYPTRGVVNVDQALALTQAQALFRSFGPQLRAPDAESFLRGLLRQLAGTLPAEAVDRLDRLRTPRAQVVLGMWDAVLDEDPGPLADLEQWLLDVPADVPVMVVSGLDQGDEYDTWLRDEIPGVRHERYDSRTHYPHLLEPARFTRDVNDFAQRLT